MINWSKPIFHQPVKNKQESYQKLKEKIRNDDFTTRNLLDYLCHKNIIKSWQLQLMQLFFSKLIS